MNTIDMDKNRNHQENETLTLKEIRKLLSDIESERARPDLSAQERILLEESALSLRDAERSAILDMETDIVKKFEENTKDTKLHTKHIRALVTKFNKLPKNLDTTETVIKECVRILTIIANLTLVLVILFSFTGCATMNKAQIKRVNSLAFCSDSLSVTPVAIFENLSDIRLERNLMYAASISDTENRLRELNAIADFKQKEEKVSNKAQIYTQVLNSYVRALKSLSNETRWKQSGTEIRALGRNADSLITAYNTLDWSNDIDFQYSRQIGKTGGFISESYYKRRQYKAVKEMLSTGDTIVSACCDALTKLLKDKELKQLIENEEKGLESDYKSYLNAMKIQKREPNPAYDRLYIEMKGKIADTKEIKTKCINALNTFKRSHHRLLLQMEKSATYPEFSADLEELTSQYISISNIINKE